VFSPSFRCQRRAGSIFRISAAGLAASSSSATSRPAGSLFCLAASAARLRWSSCRTAPPPRRRVPRARLRPSAFCDHRRLARGADEPRFRCLHVRRPPVRHHRGADRRVEGVPRLGGFSAAFDRGAVEAIGARRGDPRAQLAGRVCSAELPPTRLRSLLADIRSGLLTEPI